MQVCEKYLRLLVCFCVHFFCFLFLRQCVFVCLFTYITVTPAPPCRCVHDRAAAESRPPSAAQCDQSHAGDEGSPSRPPPVQGGEHPGQGEAFGHTDFYW